MINKAIANNEFETEKIGKDLIVNFPENKLIIIIGEIGSGKTVLVKGIAKELGISDIVNSPTFSIKKTYKNLVHYDLYFATKKQLSINEFNALIAEDLVDNYVVIEWGDNLLLKDIKNFLKVNITVQKNQKRNIKWKLKGN